jgi:hypothetical protein
MCIRRRARWASLEFVTEAASALTGIAQQSPATLARYGKCVYGCTLEVGGKQGEILCRGGDQGTGDARR